MPNSSGKPIKKILHFKMSTLQNVKFEISEYSNMTIVADPAIYQGNITVFLNFIKWNMKIECKQQGRRNGRFSGEEQKIFPLIHPRC